MYKKSYVLCAHCNKEIVSSRHKDHESKCLRMQAEKAKPPKPVGRPKGIPAWNKGLTAETNDIVKQYAESNKGKPGNFKGKKHTTETKQSISRKMSVNNKGGRSKWYDVNGQSVQGTWERDIATKLTELGIVWLKLKTNKHTLTYNMDGKQRSYTPDFYLPLYDIYLEIKGFWWGRDKEKMEAVQSTHKDIRICVVEREQFDKIMQGELVWL